MSAPGWDLLLGPVSGLVIALVILGLLVRGGYFAPWYVVTGKDEQIKKLEEENGRHEATLVEKEGSLLENAKEMGQLREQIARLEERVDALNREIKRLTRAVEEA